MRRLKQGLAMITLIIGLCLMGGESAPPDESGHPAPFTARQAAVSVAGLALALGAMFVLTRKEDEHG